MRALLWVELPLTRVRRTLGALAEAVTVAPGFAALPEFTGPGSRG
ncbi:hypothetical protein [Streptomyces sp. NPDC048496]